MKILLNGLELARQAEGERTVGDVLAEVSEDVRRGGKVVTRIAVAGRAISEGRRDRVLAARVDDVPSLELAIDDPEHLRRRTIQDAGELIEKLVGQCKPLSRKFRIGDEVAANLELADYLEDLKWVVAGLDYSTRGHQSQGGPASARGRLMDSARQLVPTLDRIYQAQAAGDCIAIADEIEYELLELLAGWSPLVGQVRQEMQSLPQEK
ncbi:MAG: hypothetical protein PHI18_06480 [bacterium]|nr:hypothetical protein [bacterium]